MADDASCLFNLPDISFLVHMSTAYPQPLSWWQISPLPPELLSCVISTVRRKTCKQLDGLLLHPVDQSYSPRSIPTSYQNPPSLQASGPTYPILQATPGPTW